MFATNASPACDAAAKVAFELAEKYESELVVFHVFGEPSHGSGAFVTDYVTGEKESAGPDYTDWVKEEMINTYDPLIKKHGTPSFETIAGILIEKPCWMLQCEVTDSSAETQISFLVTLRGIGAFGNK